MCLVFLGCACCRSTIGLRNGNSARHSSSIEQSKKIMQPWQVVSNSLTRHEIRDNRPVWWCFAKRFYNLSVTFFKKKTFKVGGAENSHVLFAENYVLRRKFYSKMHFIRYINISAPLKTRIECVIGQKFSFLRHPFSTQKIGQTVPCPEFASFYKT